MTEIYAQVRVIIAHKIMGARIVALLPQIEVEQDARHVTNPITVVNAYLAQAIMAYAMDMAYVIEQEH